MDQVGRINNRWDADVKNVLYEENINDISYSDPPAAETIVYLYIITQRNSWWTSLII